MRDHWLGLRCHCLGLQKEEVEDARQPITCETTAATRSRTLDLARDNFS